MAKHLSVHSYTCPHFCQVPSVSVRLKNDEIEIKGEDAVGLFDLLIRLNQVHHGNHVQPHGGRGLAESDGCKPHFECITQSG